MAERDPLLRLKLSGLSFTSAQLVVRDPIGT